MASPGRKRWRGKPTLSCKENSVELGDCTHLCPVECRDLQLQQHRKHHPRWCMWFTHRGTENNPWKKPLSIWRPEKSITSSRLPSDTAKARYFPGPPSLTSVIWILLNSKKAWEIVFLNGKNMHQIHFCVAAHSVEGEMFPGQGASKDVKAPDRGQQEQVNYHA